MRLRKAYTVHWPDGSVDDYTVFAPNASKARAEVFSNVSDAWSITFKEFLGLKVSLRRAPERDIALPDRHELAGTLSEKQLHVVTHAYGGTNPSAGNREHFYTESTDPLLNSCADLGLFVKLPPSPSFDRDLKMTFFVLTKLGKQVAAGEVRLYPTWMETRP